LDLTKQRKKKKLSLTQAYTKLYWKDKIENIVNERWKADWLSAHPDYDANNPSERIPVPGIAFRNKIVRRLYDSELETIKSMVQEYREETGEQSDSSDDEQSEDGARKMFNARQRRVFGLVFYLDSVEHCALRFDRF
jgi:hypothetical protein